MNRQMKAVVGIIPVSVTNGGTASGYIIDTMGYDFCSIAVNASASNAATNKLTVLKLTEGDTTDATNHSNISGAVGGTDFVIPNDPLGLTPTAMFNFSTKARRRYIGVQASPVTTQLINSVAMLSKAEQSPTTAAKAGVAVLVDF